MSITFKLTTLDKSINTKEIVLKTIDSQIITPTKTTDDTAEFVVGAGAVNGGGVTGGGRAGGVAGAGGAGAGLLSLEYRYALRSDESVQYEAGSYRKLDFSDVLDQEVTVRDIWRNENDSALISKPFTQVFFGGSGSRGGAVNGGSGSRGGAVDGNAGRASNVRLLAQAVVSPAHALCVISDELENVAIMKPNSNGQWRVDVECKNGVFEYRYAIVELETKRIVDEEKTNRQLTYTLDAFTICNDFEPNLKAFKPKCAGVAVPVFSLRSQKSYGVGDFADLVPFADWAKSVGISLIQLLPINDTTSTNTFVDSYPYKGITVFGLHPVFLNLDELTEHLTSDEKAELEKERAKLNDLPKVDYVSAMQLKKKYSYLAYERSRESLLESDEFQAFCAENEDWLVDYSVFCYLRDEYETADFRKWEDFAEYDSEKVKTLLASSVSATKEIEYYQFVQFYLNKQLHYAVDYCHKIKLALKGDLPIGISRDSVDAWVAPSLYNMSFQTGAPPDPFSQTGQNWGFPTYNWQEMQKDDYKWWRRRLSVMSRYFDALRIDHILGFFRIWEIPLSSVRGLLGHFSPAMPLSLEELRVRGVRLDIEKFTKPFINDEILQRLFGDSADKVKDAFLTPVAVTGAGAPTPAAPAAPAAPAGEVSGALYEFKEQFNTQVKIKEFIDKNPEYYADATEEYTDKLYTLLENVLFLKDKDEKDHYHPRIFLADSMAAEYIGDIQKNILLGIHDDFFFVRHNEYWAEQALIKLPTVRFATNMLICGEDLGMIPDSVPEVLKKINLLRLIVQRMSPIPSEAFVPLKTASYNAVCTPGTHDMSVLREWWHENRDLTQKFYNDYLNLSGPAPYDCEPPIVEKILKDHFDSPAMLAIIQLQDLLDSYGGTRFEGSPSEERINVPAIMPYYWQYRMHLYIEDLQNQGELNEKLTRLITEANRKL